MVLKGKLPDKAQVWTAEFQSAESDFVYFVPDTSLGKADPPRMQRFRTVEKPVGPRVVTHSHKKFLPSYHVGCGAQERRMPWGRCADLCAPCKVSADEPFLCAQPECKKLQPSLVAFMLLRETSWTKARSSWKL